MNKKGWKGMSSAGPGAVYGLGFIGAVIFYLQQAGTLWEGVVGILKALVWPALLVYRLLQILNI